MRTKKTGRPMLVTGIVAIAMTCLSGCAAASTPAPRQPEAKPATVTVDNCGTAVDFASAPERVVTIKSTSTEMLLALGLADRIVGTAFQDGPLPEQYKPEHALPVLADRVPSQEVVLTAEPDLVYAGWESNFSADGAGERSDLGALGIASYVSPAACKEAGYQPEKLGFDDIFAEIHEVARIFRADDKKLLDAQKALLASIKPDTRGLTALWFSSGSDTPYIGAGIGAPQLILDTIGLTNIAGAVKDTWTPYSWEAVIDANPDVIVLVDSSWNSADKKIGILEANPVTAQLDAVKNRRYLVVPFAASEAGVRTVSAAADLSRQLARLGGQ
jgi:iron complex transport system substrate-binding protein